LAQVGQNLEEELTVSELGDWFDVTNKPINLGELKSAVKGADIGLYGGHQFERLLSSFKSITSQPSVFQVTKEEVKVAATVTKRQLNDKSDIYWVASHIIRKRCQQFAPLIRQLIRRGTFILKRLSDISFSLVDARRDHRYNSSAASLFSLSGYTYFCSVVRDLYYDYIDSVAKICSEKCMEEISSMDMIYWEVSNSIKLPKNSQSQQDFEEFIASITTKAFSQMSQKMSSNILMKCHHFFFGCCRKRYFRSSLKRY